MIDPAGYQCSVCDALHPTLKTTVECSHDPTEETMPSDVIERDRPGGAAHE